MKCIVGLGNPGKKYELTRHNLGRLAVRLIAENHQVEFSKNAKWKALTCEFKWCEEDVLLLAPETYMNRSGFSLNAMSKYMNLEIEKDLLVIVDDLDLPFGKIRLRPQGGTGGHNGLASISDSLRTKEFARLRMGIGRPDETLEHDVVSDYVLTPFFDEERKELKDYLERAQESCERWLSHPIEEAMKDVNA